jgi:RHS repeat-associated protein
MGDHLGSSNVVVDSDGALVNREEFTPYGETSFGSFAKKRYRFTGKERDEESGFYYHGSRYYAAWLGKWTATDPSGVRDGHNLYRYCSCQPLRLRDEDGMQGQDPTTAEIKNPEPKSGERYSIAPHDKHPPQPERKGGKNLQGHHPIQDKWAKENVSGYRGKKAPSQLLATGKGEEHTKISNLQRDSSPDGGDWGKKTFSEARAEAVDQYRDAGLFTNEKQGAKAILESDAHFFSLGDEVRTDPTTGKMVVVKHKSLGEQLAEAEAKFAAKEAELGKMGSRALKKGGKATLKKVATTALKAVPFAGLGIAANSARKNYQRGNYGAAIVDIVGMTPFLGDVVDLGVLVLSLPPALPMSVQRDMSALEQYEKTGDINHLMLRNWGGGK